MDHTTSDPWTDLQNYIHQAVRTAVEATRLGIAPDPDLTTTITSQNIINAVHNLPKGRHRP